jgi:hypothetical protein
MDITNARNIGDEPVARGITRGAEIGKKMPEKGFQALRACHGTGINYVR